MRLHEICHNIVGKNYPQNPNLQNLISILKQLRVQNNYQFGLSALGSDSFYADEDKVNEDITEILAMYFFG
jgi:hypothetical protein